MTYMAHMARIAPSYMSSKQALSQSSSIKWLADTEPAYSGLLTAQALQQVGSHKPGKIGRPRLDNYTRLLHRFYEPLILLSALGVTRGAHSTTTQHDTGPNGVARRRLLQHLAYMCDFDKGGPSTTSIGIEEQNNRYIFWVASNKACADKISNFLELTMEHLRAVTKMETEPTEDTIRTLVINTISFAKKRITKESKLFSQAINRCIKYLDQVNSSTDRHLAEWLKSFDNLDHVELCYQAYGDRHKESLLDREGPILSRGNHQSEAAKAFAEAKHFLGRLGHHIRAPIQAVDDALAVSSLLETYSVKQIPTLMGALRPNGDDKIQLRGILRRMLPNPDEDQFSELCNSLEAMDLTLGLTEKIKAEYAKENFHPIIHCEIQVLEHFYKNNLIYADNDRYIGCSKPACFCCHLYIQHHPARCIVPDSHQKIYLNWSPPALEASVRHSKSPEFKKQRDLLGKMLGTIRPQALDQIVKKAGPKTWHPDSLTGITKIEKGLSQLGIGMQEKGYVINRKGLHVTSSSATSSPPVINNDDPLDGRDGYHGKQDSACDDSDESDGGAGI